MDLRNIFRRNKKDEKTEQRSVFDTYQVYGDYVTYNGTNNYSQSKAMNLAAAYRCVEVISDAIAQLPIECFHVDEEGYKTKHNGSPVCDLLKSPSKSMTKFTFIKMLISSVLLKGNGYALIERNNKGIATNLQFVPADRVSVKRLPTGEPIYNVVGIKQPVKAEDMIHILNFSYDGVVGVSTIEHAKNTLGLSYDSESHATGFFRGGANLAGILKVVGTLTNQQKQSIKAGWQQAFNAQTGTPNGVAILEGNMDFQPITVNPADAQLLETRKFNVVDVCRFFGVSPIKCFDLDAANYSTVEATQLAFLTDTLSPLMCKMEEELSRKLGTTVNFDESALLRTDKSSQAEYFAKLINAGIMTPSEARKQLGLPYKEEADQLFLQTNMSTMKNISKGVVVTQTKKKDANK